ncbi:MAG: type II secretion system F family protein [Actinomycetota bacterium]
MTAALAALGIVAGVPIPLVAAGWAAAAHPTMALAGIVGYCGWLVWRKRRSRSGPDDEAGFLQSLSAELTGGASLRSALVAAADRTDRLPLHDAARAAAVGMPTSRVAVLLGSALPVNGRMTAAAWLLAAESGGPAASVIQSLAVRAARQGELIRERRSLTAQARASAWVVAGLPAILLLGTVVSGRLDADGDPALGFIVFVGVTLQAMGVAVVVAMVRRADR